MKFSKTFFIITIITFNCSLYAQVQISGNLRTHINSIISNMPQAVGGNQYQEPSPADLTTWGNIIVDILNEDFADAHTKAQSIDYQLIEYTDSETSSIFYVLENANINYWGTFVYDPTPLRNRLFIQAPHPIEDFNTGKQAYHVFLNTGSRAFLMSGTSRCNSSTYSGCDGQTSVCTDPPVLEDYRISDQAHVVNSTFQKTTEIFESIVSNMIYVQLHGFTKGETDPYVIMGNGINNSAPDPAFQYLESLKSNLLLEDDTLTFKIAHVDNWTRLTGTTNTQGRYVNGSTVSPCTTGASTNTGRFLHLEQEKDRLRATETGWDKMANALAATFVDLLPVELTIFTAEVKESKIVLNWETATEINNYGFEIERNHTSNQHLPANLNSGEWERIGFIEGHGNSNTPKKYSFVDTKISEFLTNFGSLDGILNYRLKQIDLDGKFEYSKIITVKAEKVLSLPTEFTLEQNYPNPFNPTTTIAYSIPALEARNTQSPLLHVTLKIYDMLGNEVATLVNEHKQTGKYKVNFDAKNLTSGVYLYTLRTGQFNQFRKMLLLK